MQKSLNGLKVDMQAIIETDVNHIFNEILNEYTNILRSGRLIIRPKCTREKLAAVYDKTLKMSLQKNITEWFVHMETEFINRQIVDASQTQVMIILREQYYNIVRIETLISEANQRIFRGFLCLVEPSMLSTLLESFYFCTNPQYRCDAIKAHLNNDKVYLLEVVEDKMDEFFKIVCHVYNTMTIQTE